MKNSQDGASRCRVGVRGQVIACGGKAGILVFRAHTEEPLDWLDNPIMAGLSLAARGALSSLLKVSARALGDGLIPASLIPQARGTASPREWRKATEELQSAGVIEIRSDGCIYVRDWETSILPAAKVEHIRQTRKAAGARGGAAAMAAGQPRETDGRFGPKPEQPSEQMLGSLPGLHGVGSDRANRANTDPVNREPLSVRDTSKEVGIYSDTGRPTESSNERGAIAPISSTKGLSVRQETRSHGLRPLSEYLGGPVQ